MHNLILCKLGAHFDLADSNLVATVGFLEATDFGVLLGIQDSENLIAFGIFFTDTRKYLCTHMMCISFVC